MKGKIAVTTFVLIIFLVVVGIAITYFRGQERSLDTILLLRPDLTMKPELLTGWKNIAAEEGLHLDVQFDSDYQYTKNPFPTHYKGIILADIIHSRVSPGLAKKLRDYVESGGHLMLVYDVGTQDVNGNYYKKGSLFSDMLNLDYASNYDEYDTGTEFSPVGHSKEILESLGIPPGKYMLPEFTLNNSSPANQQQENAEPNQQKTNTEPLSIFNAISTYGYGIINYQHFTTQKIEQNFPLLLTTEDRQFIAGTVNFGKGKILFVNLPLTQLWLGTDSMPLHIFLRYFAVDILHLPALSTVPNGRGGIIMNLHIESRDDINTLPTLKKIGLFEQGPYSIDFTAGPDQDKVGDNQGANVVYSQETQNWIKYFLSLGHVIGSDGGWIHNYFGLNVSESNQAEFQPYVSNNIEAIEKITNQKVLEYVPSMGNQPNWVTRYLEKEKFLGYYTLSNIGVGPTQNFRLVFDDPHLWSYPPLPFGRNACFRDFGFAKLPVELATDWVTQSTQFVARNHTSRLMYFHPSDLSFFPQYLSSLEAWLATAKKLTNQGIFQWYSMVGMSKFLNERRRVLWILRKKGNIQIIQATHPVSLKTQTWLIRKDIYNKPNITLGTGDVREDERNWIITAGDVDEFEFRYMPLTDG